MKTKLLSFIVIIYLNGSYSQNLIIKTTDWSTDCLTTFNKLDFPNIIIFTSENVLWTTRRIRSYHNSWNENLSSLYPNPAIYQFTTNINMQNNHSSGVSIYDIKVNIMSELKNQKNTFSVNTNNIINGMYFVKRI